MNKFIEIERTGSDGIIYKKKNGDIIGEIYFYKPWKMSVFAPYMNTIWNIDCLEEVINFMKEAK